MTALKTALRIIALIIIMAIVGYVLFFVNGAQTTLAPGHNGGAASQTVQVPITIQTIKEQASTSPQVSVEYPQFPTLSAAFNTSIEKSVTDRLAQFRTEAAENYKARKTTAPVDEHVSPSDFTFIATWEPAQINARNVSFIIRFDSYIGGANENQELQTFDYSVDKKMAIGLTDLFPNSPDVLQQLSSISSSQLAAHMQEAAGKDVPLDMMKEGTAPKAENFQDFTFTEKALTIYFPKYAVAPGAFGEQKVAIPLSDIK